MRKTKFSAINKMQTKRRKKLDRMDVIELMVVDDDDDDDDHGASEKYENVVEKIK